MKSIALSALSLLALPNASTAQDSWYEEAELLRDVGEDHGYGAALALDGDTLAVGLPGDETLCAQLATVRYGVTSAGRIRVESKQERKRRGLSSPDRADALMMTFAAPATPLPPELSAAGRGRGPKPFDRELGF